MADAVTLKKNQDVVSQIRGTRLDSGDSALPHAISIPHATYAPWLADAPFQRIHTLLARHTLVDIYRCYELWDLLGQMAGIPGDVLEVGVWRGGTGALLCAAAARLAEPRTVYLCDTFQGVAKAGPNDPHYRGGEHADTSEMTVIDLLMRAKLLNARILKGIFPEETGNRAGDGPFCLCHIDVDVYDSAKDVLAWVWPRLSVGGAVVFDDYGFISCQGVTRLVNECIGKRGWLVLRNLNGHAVMVKTAP